MSDMTQLTPRVHKIFSKTKAVCFGRFVVDVPETAIVVWADAVLPFEVTIYPGGWGQVKEMAKEFEQELRNERAIYHDDAPLLLSTGSLPESEGKIITGYEGFESINDLKIRAYFRLGDDGVVLKARPLRDEAEETVALINSIARRLRHRSDYEVPSEPGNCLEYAFLPDEANAGKRAPAELIRIGFRLKEFPDTHLSIFTGPSNPHYSDGNSLEWQLNELEKNLRMDDRNGPRLKTRYLRRGARQLNGWLDGFEALSRTPELPDSHSIHDFALAFKGTPTDPLKPYADIRMQTGVDGNVAGGTRTSLSDEEAIAVWDKITGTIRARPTVVAAKNTSADIPRLPLGELAATGRVCPQTGWWQSSEANAADGGRQHFKSGERMPHVTSVAKPTLWQYLKGERATYRAATMWRLVEYGDAVAPAVEPTQSQEYSADQDKAGRTADDTGETAPPSQRG
ncbi:T6SS immunity protein Tli4 family protein [Massilia sp. TN1-12]|uniref:T6SS immunity protein Tli4 family protein n=1 Tax=Massilia paldalensis TaxID=3377675 RepID=UPI00384C9BFE